jgi:ketosteroid isomerase-like protein
MPESVPSDHQRAELTELAAWFRALERCVRAVDYKTARGIFAEDVASFGTRAEMVTGLDNLVERQWSGVWPFIEDFTFRLDQLSGAVSGDVAWAAAPWTSTGFDEHGQPFLRPGRATVAFARRDGRWVATHTHFSLDPGTPHRSHGRASTASAS